MKNSKSLYDSCKSLINDRILDGNINIVDSEYYIVIQICNNVISCTNKNIIRQLIRIPNNKCNSIIYKLLNVDMEYSMSIIESLIKYCAEFASFVTVLLAIHNTIPCVCSQLYTHGNGKSVPYYHISRILLSNTHRMDFLQSIPIDILNTIIINKYSIDSDNYSCVPHIKLYKFNKNEITYIWKLSTSDSRKALVKCLSIPWNLCKTDIETLGVTWMIKNYIVPSHVLSKYAKEVPWDFISNTYPLNYEFINSFADYLNFNILGMRKLDPKIIIKWKSRFIVRTLLYTENDVPCSMLIDENNIKKFNCDEWYHISKMILTIDFLVQFEENIHWDIILCHMYSIDIYRIFPHRIKNWYIINVIYCPEDIIDLYMSYINPTVSQLNNIIKLHTLSNEFILKWKFRLDPTIVCNSQKIDIKLTEYYISIGIDYNNIKYPPPVSCEFIENNYDSFGLF